ncbi:hypothetical protein [Actinobacillus genomosp. 1]|uniref:hypothetical protein n=1 Tax=Actinobacillus genomosp. 1 TaxID=254839 RepID=UPI002440F072|nr:hypothetical protein [Actinobacillus genomosp. 1]WGE92167.1 hypothetical protein NYR63_04225 [Actinobacillus genomosp. 1]
MKKKHIFIVFGGIISLGIYSIVSGSLQKNIKSREENTRFYNALVRIIKKSNTEYKILSGRIGGTFTFEIDIDKDFKESDLINFLNSTEFKYVPSSNIAYCNKSRGVRLTKEEKSIILEYEMNLSECK